MSLSIHELSAGQEIGSRTIEVTRTDLVKYAGASGDFNPIHWNEAFATSVELPGVIAHGMFTKPVLVTDTTGTPDAGATIEVSGIVGKLDAEANTARVDLTVMAAGQKVLMKAQAVVRLS